MLCTVFNKSWKQHPTKQQLYCHLPPISQTIQERQAKHAGQVRTNSMFSYGLLHMNTPALGDQQKSIFISSVQTLGAI